MASRIETLEKLWGPGFLAPGGAERALRLAKPLALTPASNFLEVGSGLGGNACAIAAAFGSWVDGIEPESDLAKAGAAFVRSQDCDEKVKIRVFDPATAELRPKRYDAVLAIEAFSALPAKERFIVTVVGSLKSGGSFHMTDYVIGDTPKEEAIRQGWPVRPGEAVGLWHAEALLRALGENGLNVRIDEDGSLEHADEAVAAWLHLCESLSPGEIGPEQVDILFGAGRSWAARINALRAGAVTLRRIFAIKT